MNTRGEAAARNRSGARSPAQHDQNAQTCCCHGYMVPLFPCLKIIYPFNPDANFAACSRTVSRQSSVTSFLISLVFSAVATLNVARVSNDCRPARKVVIHRLTVLRHSASSLQTLVNSP